MAYGRNDRDYPRNRGDDRQRLSGRWVQDDDTGYLRRRFEDFGPDEDAHGGRSDREGLDYGDQRYGRGAGGYYGGSDRAFEREGGHAFDFARRDSGRSDIGGRVGDPSLGETDRFSDGEGYGGGYGSRFGSGPDPRYGDRTGQDPSRSSPRGGWPQRDNWISRYVAADARSGEHGSSGQSGSFRGKGPKGYVRSDERIREDVSDRLSDEDRLDASDITVEVSGGEVTLSGYVDSRQAKRMAEDCAEQCAGVGHIQNNLRVRSAVDSGANPTGSATGQFGDKPKTTDV
jgi:hypothetical protein